MEPPSRPRRKKRRGSGLLGDAVSRFMGKGKRNSDDVSVSMDSLRSRAKKTAARLKQKVGKHYNLMFDKAQGIPIREGLQGMYRIERDRTIRRCGLFTLHFALLLFIVSNVYDVHVAFTTNDAITDLFLDEPFEDATYKKNFYEVMTQGEFWTWVQGPLRSGLYPPAWYNNMSFTEGETGYVLHSLRIVGGVRLRQMRMPHDSCFERRAVDDCVVRPWNVTTQGSCPNALTYDANAQTCCVGVFDSKDGRCFDRFDESIQDKQPFGPIDPATGVGKYTWSDGMSPMEGLFGFGESYGTGGYVVDLPTTDTDGNASAVLSQLEADRWTDEGTAAVAVYFNLYNTNTRLLSTVRILFEFGNTGHVIKSAKIFTIKLVVYEARMDKIRLVSEFVYLAGWAMYVWVEIITFYRSRPRKSYFTNMKNLYEMALLTTEALMVMQWVTFTTSTTRQNFDSNAEGYTDMYQMTYNAQLAYSWAGAVGLGCAVKLFQYMSLSKKLNTLWLTLERAAADLAAFFIGFLVVVCGFAFAAEHIFGFAVAEFHNFPSSFSTLLRYVLGIFDYSLLAEARPEIAPWFFALHVLVMVLVILSMFVAIVTKYFDEVHEEVKVADRWQNSTKSFEGALVIQASLRWAQLTSKCRRNTDSVYGARNTWWRTQLQSLKAEQTFMNLLNKCRVQAKSVHSIELYEFFYKMFQQEDADHMYIGVHELCVLFARAPCPVGKHHMKNRSCLAHELLVAYNNWKTVIMLGDVRAHKLVSSDVTARGVLMFTVTKSNMSGMEQLRLVCLDNERHALLNFDQRMRLRKQLPLRNLIQIEQSNADDCHLSLVFVDPRLEHELWSLNESGDLVHKKPETLYNLRFMSPFHKDEFVKAIIEHSTAAASVGAETGPHPSSPSEEKQHVKVEHMKLRKQTAALLAGLKRQVEDLVTQVDRVRAD